MRPYRSCAFNESKFLNNNFITSLMRALLKYIIMNINLMRILQEYVQTSNCKPNPSMWCTESVQNYEPHISIKQLIDNWAIWLPDVECWKPWPHFFDIRIPQASTWNMNISNATHLACGFFVDKCSTGTNWNSWNSSIPNSEVKINFRMTAGTVFQ